MLGIINKIDKKILLALLLISIFLNGYLFIKNSNLNKQVELERSIDQIEVMASSYCKMSLDMTDDQIEEAGKSLEGISNVVIEDYEGEKTLYYSYMPYDGRSDWSDTRLILDECN